MVGAFIGHQKPTTALNKGEGVKPFILGAMSTNMTPEEFWAMPATRCEVELLQETLKNIANELGQERAAVQLPRLNLILQNVTSRLTRLELDVEDPPTHNALQGVRSARR